MAELGHRWKTFRALAVLGIVFLVAGRALNMNLRATVGIVLLILCGGSYVWTTWKTRHLLRNALGRKLRDDEETSIKTWMTISGSGLDETNSELQGNPFESVLNEINTVLIDDGLPDHDILKREADHTQMEADTTPGRPGSRPKA
jgi:hypothetical protein